MLQCEFLFHGPGAVGFTVMGLAEKVKRYNIRGEHRRQLCSRNGHRALAWQYVSGQQWGVITFCHADVHVCDFKFGLRGFDLELVACYLAIPADNY